MDFTLTEEQFQESIQGKKLFVRKPRRVDGRWAVDIVEGSLGPLADLHERIPCSGYVSAKKTYNWAMKQLGKSF